MRYLNLIELKLLKCSSDINSLKKEELDIKNHI